jgi:hypothetical protein
MVASSFLQAVYLRLWLKHLRRSFKRRCRGCGVWFGFIKIKIKRLGLRRGAAASASGKHTDLTLLLAHRESKGIAGAYGMAGFGLALAIQAHTAFGNLGSGKGAGFKKTRVEQPFIKPLLVGAAIGAGFSGGG